MLEGDGKPRHRGGGGARHSAGAAEAGAEAGDFTLQTRAAWRRRAAAKSGYAGEDDIALVLHTSGTTSRPKIVPLTQTNVTASAYHIGQTLALTPGDVCLNIMPLFHIHGLIAATLSSIAAGARVVCTPGFNALKFFSWFEETDPTWYTAVPTMHQAILSRAERNRAIIEKGHLRLIRSSSSSLPPQVMEALEKTFGVPVIEAYGMTEAATRWRPIPCRPGRAFPAASASPRGPKSASWMMTAICWAPASWAKSSSGGAMSPRAMKPIPTPTPRPSPMAGFAPATRA